MQLVNVKVREYLDLLASNAPAPGGGSAAALVAAEGIALLLMVARLTIGKKKYEEFAVLNENAINKGSVIYEKLINLVDEDAVSFNGVSEAYKLPKETEEEKNIRNKAISEGYIVATQVPFETMVLCQEALILTESLIGKSNATASSDLGVAALNLRSAILSAWLNIKINLGSIKDEEKKAYFRNEGEKIVKKGVILSEEIYDKILSMY